MNDKHLLDAAALQLDEAELALTAICTEHPAHTALIEQALAAIRAADALMARVALAG